MAELHFACNDRNGRCLNCAQLIDVIDGEHTVSLYSARAITVRFSARRVHVGRRVFDAVDRSRFQGNLAWDAVTVELGTAKGVLRYLIERGWTVEEATIGGPLREIVREYEGRTVPTAEVRK